MGLNPKRNLQGLSLSIRNRPDPTDLDGNLVTASVSSESSTYGNDPADSRQLSPLTSDYKNGSRTVAGSPFSMMANNQSSVPQINSREALSPMNVLFNSQLSPSIPKRRPLSNTGKIFSSFYLFFGSLRSLVTDANYECAANMLSSGVAISGLRMLAAAVFGGVDILSNLFTDSTLDGSCRLRYSGHHQICEKERNPNSFRPLRWRLKSKVGFAKERNGESVAGDGADAKPSFMHNGDLECVIAPQHEHDSLVLGQTVYMRLHSGRRIHRPLLRL
ncbi:hypothetical protein F0562_027902 [Nyssa sinensis]|uniref:Uncharacterized protein n=1 Tax=Nyssa sinensis TaxID=561372 RepID=A0A5J5B4U8_9ASTE|nr:hypothetical protein F0562_027902 [Nyssa sinensis]